MMRRLYSSLRASDLIIERAQTSKLKGKLELNVPFGSVTTDHMLEVDYHIDSGWSAPHIKPYQPLKLSPASSVLNYCTEVYEGMKCYASPSDDLLLFRPHKNMERMKLSCEAVGLPQFDGNELLECIKQLILLEKDWVPRERMYSLYIRPALIGTSAQLRFGAPTSAKMFVVLTPVGPYFPGGFKPVKLYCDDNIVRAWPGGSGNKKLGANYAPGIVLAEAINKKGFDQILWLTNKYVTEVGTMNFFMFWVNEDGHQELVTSPLDSLILPGITRNSILSLARNWGDFLVNERRFTIDEMIKAIKEERVIEAFGAGTACIVCPVSQIHYEGANYDIPMQLGSSGVLTQKILDTLLAIQHGEVSHPWSYTLNTPLTKKFVSV